MNWFLGLALLGVMLLGYVLMGRIDRTLSNSQPPHPAERPAVRVLLFGQDPCRADLEKHLAQDQISNRSVETPACPGPDRYDVVLALSDDDSANLLFCVAARHACQGVRTCARCNQVIYLAVFRQAAIDQILSGPVDGDALVRTVHAWL